MSEIKLVRLMAAAKEFNIGRETLVDFLAGKNFNREDLNGNVKLSEEMYRALEKGFRDDKVAKNKADSIEIPKGVQSDRKKKEKEVASKKETSEDTTAKTETPTASPEMPVVPIVEKTAPATTPVADPAPTPVAPIAEVKNETPVAPVEQKSTPAPVENVVEPKAPIVQSPAPTPENKPEQKETVKEEVKPLQSETKQVSIPEHNTDNNTVTTTPEIEGLKVLDKIDLSTIDSSTRPKKQFKDEKTNPQQQHKPQTEQKKQNNAPQAQGNNNNRPQQAPKKAQEPAKMEKPKAPATPIIPVTPETFQFKEEKKTVILTGGNEQNDDTKGPEITKIHADRLTGPVILGKIELPVDNDTRPKNKTEKRKRKRMPVDAKGGNNTPHQGQGNQQHGGGQQGGRDFQNRNSNNGSQQAGGQQGGYNRPYNGNNNGPRQGGQQQAGGQQGGYNRPNNGPRQSGPQQGAGQGGYNRNNNNNRPNNNDRRGGRNDRNNNGRNPQEATTEIDQKRIQEKIRETQAKLAGNTGRGKNTKSKARRERRQQNEEAQLNQLAESRVLNVTEFITVSELANLMDVSFADIISKCMSLGIMVSINQRLDAEVIELVASEFDYTVSFIDLAEGEEEEVEVVDEEADLAPRNPIVTIMGHVDHGKTSLLDYIRNANVVAGEAGGITQHIGAYVVTLETGKKITFLDTPGHEAFTAMRARGAKVTDIAVIVVAADDAVMPQTREAISHAQAAGVPMVFAINKIDKDGANAAKIYEQLAQMNILVEEWGGKYQCQEISAKKGLNVNLLLEKILLEAEILDMKANPDREATGSIIEASLDKGRGYVATVLVQNGTLKQGDFMVSGQHYGRIKAMFNERNARIEEAAPSFPAQILGLNGAPQAGEKFKIYATEAEAKEVANNRARIYREQGLRTRKHITLDEIGRRLALGSFKELNIIIKGDVDGSVEALSDSLQKLSTPEIVVNVIYKAVGQITESDVLLATASDAIIVGFNVRPSSQAGKLANNEGVQIRSYSIIYNAIEEIKSAMEGMLEPKIEEVEAATVDIREVYKFDKATVAGCYVQEGRIKRDHKIKVFRDGILVFPRQEGAFGELGSLKRYKDDVKDVNQGYECGLTVKGFADIQVGDTLVSYQEEEIKRTL